MGAWICVEESTFDLLGVTVTDANTAKRAQLACKLLQRVGRTEVPVAVGRQTAAVPPDRVDYQFVWSSEYKPIATRRPTFSPISFTSIHTR